MKAIRTEAQFTGFSSRSDGSLSFRGTTPELSSVEKVAFMDLQDKLVEILIYPKDEKEADVVKVKGDMDAPKTPGQRLRSVLFILWKQEGGADTFEAFYQNRMEKLIQQIKGRLEQK